MHRAAVIVTTLVGALVACGSGREPTAACRGLGFSSCPADAASSPDAASSRPEPVEPCAAQIGFEDERLDGWSGPACCRLAFGPLEISGERAWCGARSLRVPVALQPDDQTRHEGELRLSLPLARVAGATSLSMFVYLDGPAVPDAMSGFLLSNVGAAMPFPAHLAERQWTELRVTLLPRFEPREPSPFPVPPTTLELELHLYSPVPWSGALFIDEISWR